MIRLLMIGVTANWISAFSTNTQQDDANDPLAIINELRNSGAHYIYIRGGMYDGAAAQQEVDFIVQSDGYAICIMSDTNWKMEDHKRIYSEPSIFQISEADYYILRDQIGTTFFPWEDEYGYKQQFSNRNFILR